MIISIYNIIKEIYERRIEILIMLITTAIALGIGIYIISMASDLSSTSTTFSNLSNIKSAI